MGQSYVLESPLPQAGAFFGTRVSLIDDLDGDSHPDVVVGSPGYDHDLDADQILESAVGRVDVFSGATGNVLLSLVGTQAGENFGFSVAGGGDVDGDGIPDFAVGAPERDNAGNLSTGAAWIFRGSDGAMLYEVIGTLQNEAVGRAVAYLGNIPRDETLGPDVFGDFAIGVPSSNFIPSRRVLVVGHEMISAVDSDFVTAAINQPIGGNADKAFGASVAGLDFNGDGTPDIAIGAPEANSTQGFSGRGRVRVYSGTNLTSQLFFGDGQNNNNQRFGASLANAGDFDGLPGDELAVGSRGFTPSGGGSSSGAVDVYAYTLGSSAGDRKVRIEGHEGNMQLGSVVAPAGDLNGDGFADIAVGQAGPSASFLGGNAWVVSGSSVNATESLATSTRIIFRVSDVITIGSGDGMGATGLAGGADTDGDGQAELLVGAANRGTLGGGQVLAFSSGPPPADPALSEIAADPLIVSSFAGISTITVTPRDSNGTLLGPGAAVLLTTTAGQLLGTPLDVGDGTYTQDLEAATGAGFAEVSATANGVLFDSTSIVVFVEVDPDTSTIDIDDESSFLGSIRTVTVTPRDDVGALLGTGLAVVISTTIGDLIGSVADNGDGSYTQTLEATILGTASITATVDDLPLTGSASLTITDPSAISDVIGAEADDTLHSYASIQEAVNNATADGLTTIFVAPGTYAETVKFKNQTGLTLEGLSASDPVILDGIVLAGSQDITIRYIEVDASLSQRNGIVIRRRSAMSSNVTLFGCYVHGSIDGRHGVVVAKDNGLVTIDSCTMSNNGRNGVKLRRGSSSLIVNSLIEANGYNGIRINRDAVTTIDTCTIINNGTRVGNGGGRYGILSQRDQNGGTGEGVTLIQNVLSGNNGKVVNGKSDAEIKNYDQIIDPTDNQPGY